MPLNFPNQSRYFDAERGAVRFWGYDGALEVSCSIDWEALQVLVPGMELNETDSAAAFDKVRTRICSVADRAYSRAPKGTLAIEIFANDL